MFPAGVCRFTLNLLEDQKFYIEQKKINEDINGAIRNHKFTELEEIEDFINKFN
jgi:hypothetical protein